MRPYLIYCLLALCSTPVIAFELNTNIQISEAPLPSKTVLLSYSNMTTGKDSQSKANGLINRMNDEVKKIEHASMTVDFNQDLINKRTFFQAAVRVPISQSESLMGVLNAYAKLERAVKENSEDDLHARQTLANKILAQKKEYCDMFKCVNVFIKSVHINQGFRPGPVMMAMAKTDMAESISVENIGAQPISLTANVVYEIQ